MQQLFHGYWPSIYPRSTLSMVFEGVYHQKRLILTPEIYLKDQDRIHEDLRLKETAAVHE